MHAHAQALGADRYAFLGDLVGYGADPLPVLDLIEEHAAKGAVVVLGNHGAAALGRSVVGSAGQPRDRSNKACYVLADLERARVTYFRVAYDHDSAAQKRPSRCNCRRSA